MWIRVFLLCIWMWLLSFCCRAQQADTARSILKDTAQLDEIIISAKTSVKINRDTVSYTVDSFYKDPMATTEDVLKRLPGVEVSRDGKISIQGKEVVKIFVNGKEYQAEDLRTITQNLPAEVLEKIQVADWYDEEAQFSGIRKGTEQKSINLQFKKKYQHGIYGRGAGGYGTKDRYQGGVFASYMGKELRLSTIGNVNNTGIADATNDAGADNARSGNIPGVQTRKQANLNFSYDGIDKLKLNGLYEISGNKTEMMQSLLRTTYLPGDSLLLRDQSSVQTNNNIQHRFNLRSQYQLSEMLNMNTYVTASLRQGSMDNHADDITYYNTRDVINFRRMSSSDNDVLSPAVRFNNMLQRRFRKKGRTLALNIQANYNYDDNSGLTENRNIYYSTGAANSSNFETEENRNSFDTRVNIKYTEPLSEKSTLSLEYSNLYTSGKNDRQVWKQDDNNGFEYDSAQSRYYENRNMENPVGLLYQYSSSKLTAGAGFDIQPYSRESRTVNQQNTTIQQDGVNYFPNLFTRYALSAKANFNLSYNGSIISPNINQLQPVPDYTDSLNIFIGNPSLRPEINNNITASYNLFDTKTQRVFWANLRGNWTNNKITNDVNINASRKITTPVNIDGAYNINASLSYTQPFFSKKIKATAGIASGVTKNITITNGSLQPVRNYNYQPSLKFLFSSLKWFEGDLNYQYRYSNIEAATAVANNVVQSHTLSANGVFFLPWDVKPGVFINYTANKGLAANFDRDFLLVHLKVDKTFDKPRGLSARVQVFDVFNNYPNVQRTFGDNYYEDRSYNRIGSYLMLSLIYRFSWFPASPE